MTVMVEALVRATRDAEGEIQDLTFGILEWPYSDLEPKQVLLVQYGLKGSDNDPMYLIALMDDDESMFEVAFRADDSIRQYAQESVSKKRVVNITRLPNLYDEIGSEADARKIRNYTVPADVYRNTADAIVALCQATAAS
ncbi:hypothetical protein [Marinobacter nauticus]|uniref:Uncharacterized protein n=1 Tax=Marinobacter nauticus (strain ATCC 700491 / DSM 11845 / VT8) TaxID=351348 RepID=A1U7Y7_MARN8|nr:hypothetical protein [Marinobacter nauticus]ABM21106.1 hypothetical protein Maqu_4255 [Marinobacter nauticus VT8]|tara:strand:- start:1345 stop:1764 length:420 start_codon:yes stop_codon:yes gene_type:complete